MTVSYTDQEVRQNVWDVISHHVRREPRETDVTVVYGAVYLDGTLPGPGSKDHRSAERPPG